ncbi:MAG: hypothetical protein RMY29_022360 [Nostoc sp. CreGUA01]|nr:hypothetical protein [Nostoc sp. CreGUA01]
MPKANAPSFFDGAALGDNIPYLLFFMFFEMRSLAQQNHYNLSKILGIVDFMYETDCA